MYSVTCILIMVFIYYCFELFQNLRDQDGNPYSPYHYSLQTSADGSIVVVPRANGTLPNSERKDQPPPQNRKE